MVKQFKFRVWDKTNGRFLEDRWNGISFLYDGVWEGVGHFMNISGFIIHSYTNLKDKNGKEVFDGDILKCKGFDGWFDKEGYYYNMEVKESVLPSGDTMLSGYLYVPVDSEVIGNVMENIEFLQK